jgi:arylsulfatase A-like enzyme
MGRQNFLRILTSLWFRLITLGIAGLAFAAVLKIAQGEAQGWTYYLTSTEVVFEVLVRLVFAALVGIVAGTVCTALIAPFLWHFSSARERIVHWTTRVAVVLVLYLDTLYAIVATVQSWQAHLRYRYWFLLLALHLLIFVAALWIPRSRRAVLTSLDGAMGQMMTRRTALATVAGTVGLVATEFALSKTAPVVEAALSPQRPKSNFLLISFDALAAEDMSLYGYKLPTTPNLDIFGRCSTVFQNFYSASTFTTPSIATMLTGVYPSEHFVYQLRGRIRPQDVSRSLPHQMRDAGFVTGAFMSSPHAYYLVEGMKSEYNFLPYPVFQQGGLQYLWNATTPLHQESGIGNRMDEYNDLMTAWNSMNDLPMDLMHRYPAAQSFADAEYMLDKLPDGFFLWVHVMTPHSPYRPDAAARGTFISEKEFRTFENEDDDGVQRWTPTYAPSEQPAVNQRRHAYDEFILTADRAFGSFMSTLEKSGRLSNTTVIVTGDHGESFEGGIYQHENKNMTRPEIHIPLIIRTPGQQQGRSVSFTADQTALAPTILELAGVSQPASMRGPSLVKYLNSNANGEGEGVAFCQHLQDNSIFKPLRHATVGVIDGEYQYVVYLPTNEAALRPLDQAQFWNLDRSFQDPKRAQAMRSAIYARFPELQQKTT